MTRSDDGPPTNILRAPVNSPRGILVLIVAGLSALGGAVAGGVAALIAATVLTPREPMSAAQVVLMAVQYGLVAGGGVVHEREAPTIWPGPLSIRIKKLWNYESACHELRMRVQNNYESPCNTSPGMRESPAVDSQFAVD
jgi:hypothetical protein